MLREVKNDTEQVDALRLDLTALRGQLDHVVRTTSPRPDWKEGCTHYPELTQCLKVRRVVQLCKLSCLRACSSRRMNIWVTEVFSPLLLTCNSFTLYAPPCILLLSPPSSCPPVPSSPPVSRGKVRSSANGVLHGEPERGHRGALPRERIWRHRRCNGGPGGRAGYTA